MRHCLRKFLYPFLFLFVATWISPVFAQSGATSGTISGTVTDSTGAVVPGATVTIVNSVSQYSRTTTSDGAGHFTLPNIPFNPYRIEVSSKGFASYSASVSVDSVVPVTANAVLQVGSSATTVTVNSVNEGVEDTPTFHTDVDRNLIEKLPLEECVVFLELAGHAFISRSGGRLQRSLPWPRRSRVEFVFD